MCNYSDMTLASYNSTLSYCNVQLTLKLFSTCVTSECLAYYIYGYNVVGPPLSKLSTIWNGFLQT